MERYGSITFDIDTLGGDLVNGQDISENEKFRQISYVKLLPRILDFLNECDIKATFFIIGKDALVDANKKILRRIVENGHEIGNHSLNHKKQFAFLEEKELIFEIKESEKILSAVIGEKICGFRCPGYTVLPRVINILEECNYLYDSSLNVSIVYNLIKRFYKYMWWVKEKNYLSLQPLRDVFAPQEVFSPDRYKLKRSREKRNIVEIPVSVVPYISYPFGSAFLFNYNYYFSMLVAKLAGYKLSHLNFLTHDNEFCVPDDLEGMRINLYLTSLHMRKELKHRVNLLRVLIEYFKTKYKLVSLKEIALRKIGDITF